ncbi:MAG: LysR family transcriptional regulator [Polaromonas sp.]|uniref:LysR family transcriptional regulator n=1 Tax=Polaromonas sp. TaxID=1869339 RepID=UPI0027362E7C|nr:LysR family transcriptional regulator [Polaromonas sp.]MDP3798654.1 LysR family transcriptional regulator [Polaromonas sp.]
MGPGNRPLDLEWLEDFLALADSGSFSRAAQRRSIAQPAFSRHIKSLEEWVGVDLFDRSAHPTCLTEAGKRFHPAIDELLQRLEVSRLKARAAHEQAASSLRFAATHVLSLTFFPQWLSGIEAQLRLGAIQMISDNLVACEELMLQRRVQFLLCHGHSSVPCRLDDTQFVFARISDDVLLPVSAPLAGGTPQYWIDDSLKKTQPILAYSQESGLGRIMRTLMPSELEEEPFTTVFTAHHAVLLKTMVMEGRGIAWLPQSLIKDELGTGKLLLAGASQWHIPVDIRLYRQRAALAAPAEALWRVVDER